jgi:hypothetical protein
MQRKKQQRNARAARNANASTNLIYFSFFYPFYEANKSFINCFFLNNHCVWETILVSTKRTSAIYAMKTAETSQFQLSARQSCLQT